MRTILLLCLLPLCSFSFTADSSSASPTQAILAYTSPDNGACTVEVSESSTYVPLVHDVDPALFAGSNLDSRAGALSSGTSRIFVVGTRQIQTASDGNNYSRALQQNTLHYYRVTCAGPTVATGTFTTKILPFGATYQDLMPRNADGTYNVPATTDVRNSTIVDPSTGVLSTLMSVAADTNAGYGATWAASGGFGEWCADTLSEQGNWHCIIPAFGFAGAYLYAVNPTTGVWTFLGLANVAPGRGVTSLGETTPWAAGSATDAYVDTGTTILRWSYTGNDVPAGTAAANVTDMLGGQSLNNIVHAYNPAMDPAHYGCQVGAVQANYALLNCRYYEQGSFAWQGAYSFGNGIPLGATGSTAGMVALNPMFATSGSRWCTDHTREFLGENVAISSNAVDYPGAPTYPNWIANHAYAAGTVITDRNNNTQIAATSGTSGSSAPTWSTSCPNSPTTDGTVTWQTYQSYTAGVCSTYPGDGTYYVTLNSNMSGYPTVADDSVETVSITSTWNPADGSSPPSGWVMGEPWSNNLPHFLQTVQPGDMLITGGNEYMKVVAKHSSTSWDVQRGVIAAAHGVHAQPHSIGEQWQLTCENINSANTYSGGYVFWDFVNSPTGTEHPGDYVLEWGSHPVNRGTYRSEYQFENNLTKARWGVPAPYSLPMDSCFAGTCAMGGGNTYQKHASLASGNQLGQFDSWYFVGANSFGAQNDSAATLVSSCPSGHTCAHVYRYDPTGGGQWAQGWHWGRGVPMFAKTSGRTLVDVSAPGKLLTDSDDYAYCQPIHDGECVTGSHAGDPYVYFSLSTLTVHYCSGGENPTGWYDICIGNWAALAESVNQVKFVTPNDTTGAQSVRPLSRLFEQFEETMAGNVKLTYDGKYAIVMRPLGSAPWSQQWALTVPPDAPPDGINRGDWVPAILKLTAPSGMGVTSARVKFWYGEFGGTPETPYCSTRREACVAVASAVSDATPFYYASESYTPASCASSCTIAIPVAPLHTAYYSAEYLNEEGTLVTSTEGMAMENTLVPLNPAAPQIMESTILGGHIQGGTIR